MKRKRTVLVSKDQRISREWKVLNKDMLDNHLSHNSEPLWTYAYELGDALMKNVKWDMLDSVMKTSKVEIYYIR